MSRSSEQFSVTDSSTREPTRALGANRHLNPRQHHPRASYFGSYLDTAKNGDNAVTGITV